MASYFTTSNIVYSLSTNSQGGFDDTDVTLSTTATDDGFWNVGDGNSDSTIFFYQGYYTSGGHTFLVFESGALGVIYSPTATTSNPGYPATYDLLPSLITTPLAVCFGAGTEISVPGGRAAVETLKPGDLVETADGRTAKVLWLGRQTLPVGIPGGNQQLVRIEAGALGNGLPERDLVVTGDHGMVLDGHVINASALVNGGAIDWVSGFEPGETVTVYHVETEGHEVILANGAPSETFIDYRDRRAFDNFDEYLELHGCERIIPEMPRPRISSARHLPQAVRELLGIGADHHLALSA